MRLKVIFKGMLLLVILGLGFGLIIATWPGDNGEEYVTDTYVVSGKEQSTEAGAGGGVRPVEDETLAEAPAPAPPAVKKVTVAWQPSHQDDTGGAGWHEYHICGDIVDRTILLATAVNNVKCWETGLGLTGSNNYRPNPTNTPAFDSEIAKANAAGADYFIAVHNDATAPSGILGECMPGDALSRQYLRLFMDSLCARTGLPDRGIREVRLYSLESERNHAPVRILLEIGDSGSDREKLESPDFRQLVAQALAEAANGLREQR